MKSQVSTISVLERQRHWEIISRLDLIEAKLFKKKSDGQASEAQRFLIFFHLGCVDPIRQLTIE